jgi:hypothetical protein
MLTILVLSYTKFWLNIYPKSKIMMNFDRTFFTMATTSIGKREPFSQWQLRQLEKGNLFHNGNYVNWKKGS